MPYQPTKPTDKKSSIDLPTDRTKTKICTSIIPMRTKIIFIFKTERTIRNEYLELTKWQSTDLRRKLPRGIYWIQIERGGLIQWNVPLLVDYIVNGDRPEHQQLVEDYISRLPQAS
jgi:hypothetical protein